MKRVFFLSIFAALAISCAGPGGQTGPAGANSGNGQPKNGKVKIGFAMA